jgi:hypothetical protein
MPIIAVTDIDDFFAQEEQAQERAALLIPVWAGTLTVGDHFLREVTFSDETITIYSEILPQTVEDEDGNEVVVPYDGSPYRFTRSFSTCCPEGELGDAHISTIARRISKEEFEAARANGWQ